MKRKLIFACIIAAAIAWIFLGVHIYQKNEKPRIIVVAVFAYGLFALGKTARFLHLKYRD